ncbi:hypothetical protein KC669_02240 [Candidatus Dojkabacteria bacterium]|uniref:Uncharacterized protein n=1 Tax=Candidatus Dojkabacteria bacterium TaxID=2099670 RepID=A0A955RLZ6_9BACT|nr:hypothetical protein [Candidatus Dojkabacteria bacterium]
MRKIDLRVSKRFIIFVCIISCTLLIITATIKFKPNTSENTNTPIEDTTSIPSDWLEYINKNGIKLSLPTDWQVSEGIDDECTYPDTKNFCVSLTAPSGDFSLIVLIVKDIQGQIPFSNTAYTIDKEELEGTKLFKMSDKLILLRDSWMNEPSYLNNAYLGIDFLINAKELNNGNISVDTKERWLKNDVYAYHLAYRINTQTKSLVGRLDSNIEIQELDRILSSLELDLSLVSF